jgi:hypothetical protein
VHAIAQFHDTATHRSVAPDLKASILRAIFTGQENGGYFSLSLETNIAAIEKKE